jgi:hypothetical protein
MSVGDFTTGIQRSWTVVDNTTSLIVDFGGAICDLEAREITKDIQVEPIDTQGFNLYKTDWGGWEGTLTVARQNGNGDLFEAAQELLYHEGGTQHNFTIEETTQNVDGSVTVMQYTGAVFTMPSAGKAQKDSATMAEFKFRAQARQPLTTV